MGQSLIIRNADFSQYAIESIPVDGKFYLNKNNYVEDTGIKYINKEGVWGNDVDEKSGLIYAISRNQTVTIKANSTNRAVFALINNTNNFVGSVDFAGDLTSRYDLKPGNSCSIKAPEDCLLYVMNLSEGLDMFPQDIYLSDYICPRDIVNTDAVRSGNLYVNNNGVWGDGTVENTGLYFSVFKGEKITIIAKDTLKTFVALLKTTVNEKLTYSVDFISSETSRHEITAGEQIELNVTEDCFLWVYNLDSQTDIFPKSIKVSL